MCESTTSARFPLHCILPPHMLDAIKLRGSDKQKSMAVKLEKEAESMREERQAAAPANAFLGVAAVAPGAAPAKNREVYDGESKKTLPGTLVRGEGDPPTGDTAADEAYDGAGATYDFYFQEFGRDSLDGAGLTLVSTVHHGKDYNNAFWNGSQMAYGDGDGLLFTSLTGDLTVIGHELSHGVVQHSGGLVYRDQSGALNEHFADVFGVLTKQYQLQQSAAESNWLIGEGLLAPGVSGVALRSMAAPGTAYDDRTIGKDPQPYHMDEYVQTQSDNGGVHINSGIPNHAFYLLAMMLGGQAWQKAGHVWYDALQKLSNPHATFLDWADATVEEARSRFGSGSREVLLTHRAWKLVGVL